MRFVVVPPRAKAELGNQSIREKTIVVEASAVRILKARSFKIALCRSPRDTENRCLQSCWPLIAESRAQAILIGKVGVHFTVKEIRVFMVGQQSKVVVRVSCCCWGGD